MQNVFEFTLLLSFVGKPFFERNVGVIHRLTVAELIIRHAVLKGEGSEQSISGVLVGFVDLSEAGKRSSNLPIYYHRRKINQ
jgi:hypothetical protein